VLTRSCADSRGFTLVEVLTALAIVTLLTVLVVPSFRSWANNQQTRTVAESVANALRLAQASAVHQSRAVTFCLTNSTPSYSLVSASNSSCVANGKNWFAQLSKLFSDESINGSSAFYVQGGSFGDVAANVAISGPAYLTFNSLGRVTASSGSGSSGPSRSYKFTNTYGDGRFLAVTIDIAGQIRLCDGSRSDTTSTDGCPATLP